MASASWRISENAIQLLAGLLGGGWHDLLGRGHELCDVRSKVLANL
jgi:hypothetical protein